MLVEFSKRWKFARELCHLRIEIYQGDVFDRRVFQNFAQGQSITAAKHEHSSCVACKCHRRMDQGLVIAVFIRGTELQVAVKEQLKTGAATRNDNTLVRRRFGVDDVVGEELIFSQRRQLVGFDDSYKQQEHHDERACSQP